VSKRVRGAARTHRRPGARPPSERTAARRRPEAGAPLSQLETATEVAEEVVEQRPAAATHELEQAVRAHPRQRAKPGSLLAARAATEYVYVAKDLRRILIVAGLLIAVMFVLWLLLIVLRVVQLPFY
jgi:hypothetical protein